MAYADVYNFGIAASVGGSSARWITSTDPQDYSSLCDAAAAFADCLANTITVNFNNPQSVTLLATIIVTFWSNRSVTSTNPSDYQSACNAIAALFTEAESRFI